ncbi:MAG TPA: hypothetical protein VGE21_13025 [Flavobacteriales bacterium]
MFSKHLLLAIPALLLTACGTPEPDDSGDVSTKTYVGTYEYNGGSHSFRLCGSVLVLPLIPGKSEQKLTGLYEKNKGAVDLEIAAHMVKAPASEGEGMDDYMEVDRVVGEKKCP